MTLPASGDALTNSGAVIPDIATTGRIGDAVAHSS